MMELISRDGLARIVKMEDEIYPKYIREENINEKVLNLEEIYDVEINEKLIEKNNVLILPGMFTKFKDPEKFVKRVMESRIKHNDKLIYLPSSVYAETIPAILYMGIDIIDDMLPKFKGLWNDDYSRMFEYYFDISVKAIRENRIRTLVESIPNPFSKTILRIMDFYYYDDLEKYYPVKGNWVNASHYESLFRPEIVRWRKRITERYRKPSGMNCLLFLPCSAVKPYSISKSHRYFKKLIESKNAHFHEVILTSPLGIVPRELENTFPANSYDIPVTGKWYEDEKKFIIEMLNDYIKNNKYSEKYAFLPEDLNFLRELFEENDIKYYFGNLHSENAREWFKDEISGCSGRPSITDDIDSVASFQYGIKFGLNGKKVKFVQEDIYIRDREDFLRYNRRLGKIFPMKEAAEFLYNNKIYYVKIDFYPKGTVYVPGIIESSKDIRKGDIVTIIKDEEIIGIGESLMGHEDMENMDRGKAVDVKKTFN
ncbi:MAG: DUF5591 domain-containing protein [Thermoplasmata archaeon]